MGMIGGNRNYGYGKQLVWAGQKALLDRYGSGHYATRAAHSERWAQFVKYLKEKDIRDARNITRETVQQYAGSLRQAVEQKTMSVAYAQNLLSTVNVVLETLRKDRSLSVSPRHYVGERSNVRQSALCLDRSVLANNKISPAQSYDTQSSQLLTRSSWLGTQSTQLHTRSSRLYTQTSQSHARISQARHRAHTVMIARLARDFGLRFREASLLDAKQALKEAELQQRINITQGTKGGRGKEKDRWVPVNRESLQTLSRAAQMQEQNRNLIPVDMSYVQWRNHAYSQWRQIAKPFGIKGFHELRAAYACERYQQLTSHPAPVMTGGQRTAPKPADQQARATLAQELGHGRTDVIAQYIGSAR